MMTLCLVILWVGWAFLLASVNSCIKLEDWVAWKFQDGLVHMLDSWCWCTWALVLLHLHLLLFPQLTLLHGNLRTAFQGGEAETVRLAEPQL